MEEEARQILRAALSNEKIPVYNLGQRIHKQFADLDGVELPAMPREKLREPPQF